MLYYFKNSKNATETHKKICAVCGEGAVSDRTCQKRLAKFCAGDFPLDNAPRSGRPTEVDSDQIETLRTINVIPCVRQLTYSKISKSSIENHRLVMLIALMFGFHNLSEKSLLDCISACNSLLRRNENVLFFKKIYLFIFGCFGSSLLQAGFL